MVARFNETGIGGPAPSCLSFDLVGDMSSRWSRKAINDIVTQIRSNSEFDALTYGKWTPKALRDLVKTHYSYRRGTFSKDLLHKDAVLVQRLDKQKKNSSIQ